METRRELIERLEMELEAQTNAAKMQMDLKNQYANSLSDCKRVLWGTQSDLHEAKKRISQLERALVNIVAESHHLKGELGMRYIRFLAHRNLPDDLHVHDAQENPDESHDDSGNGKSGG